MKHTEHLERAPRMRAGLAVRTGVRAGAEEATPGPIAPAAPSAPATPPAADTITIKLADLVKMLQCFGGSA